MEINENRDQDVLFPEDYEDGRKYFVITGFQHREERLDIERKINALPDSTVLYDVTWNDQITHVISKGFQSTELVLAGNENVKKNLITNYQF